MNKTLVGTPDPDLPDPDDFLNDMVRDLAPETLPQGAETALRRLEHSAKVVGATNETDLTAIVSALREIAAASRATNKVLLEILEHLTKSR